MIYHPRCVVGIRFVLEGSVGAALGVRIPEAWRDYIPVNAMASMLEAQVAAPFTAWVVPKSAEVELNPYHEADTATVEIDLAVFPFDPRVARAIAIEVHMGAVGSAAEAFSPAGEPMFVGYADDCDLAAGDDDTLRIEARDMTALLIDQSYDGSPLDYALPLDAIIRGMLDRYPATRPMGVDVRAGAVVLADVRSEAGATGTGGTRQSTWDVIADLAAQAGLVAWVEGRTVVVAEGQSLRSGPVTEFILGENIRKVNMRRRMLRDAPKPVVVASWNMDERRTVSGVWPRTAAPATTGDGVAHPAEAMLFRVSNLASDAEAETIARRVYERMALQDVSLDLDTAEMKGLAGEDLLRLRAGSAISLTLGPLERRFREAGSFSERRRLLGEAGFPPHVALAIASRYAGIAPFHQVVAARHRFSAEDGYSLGIEAASFIDGGAA